MRLICIVAAFLLVCEFAHGQQSEQDQRQILNVRGQIFTTRVQPKAIPLPKDDDSFHFAIYGDRTGGSPAGLAVLRQAVKDTNLMDPDLVMTVGDLIQGYNRPDEWMPQMKDFREIMSGLKMSWFPVAGNHDVYWDFRDRNRPKIHHEANYEKHFGPLWYSFKHKQCGFVALFSDEGDKETGEKGFREARLQNMSPEQLSFVDEALQKLKDCRQVFVFLHHPRWLGGGYEGSNWPEVHKRLVAAKNVRGVFAGHIHHMTYQGPIDGIEYFTLATTGGHLSMESPELGFLHHFNIVTVRDDSFKVATIPVGAVIDPKTFRLDFLRDVDTVRNMSPARAGERLVIGGNSSASSDYSLSVTNPGQFPIEVTLAPNFSGGNWQCVPDHQHVIVPPGKTEGMKFYFYRRSDTDLGWTDFSVPSFSMNVDYLHSSARIRLPESQFPVEVGLADTGVVFEKDENKCLVLRGRQSQSQRRAVFQFPNDCARVNPTDVPLPQGPITVEAWVNPTELSKSRAIVAKTQSSEYALFLHDGRPQFDIHLDGKYISPSADVEIPINQWTHIAGVFDGSEARLYINGSVVQSLPAAGSRTTNTLPLFVGADPDRNGNPTREFGGKIDEVRVSKVARYSNTFEPKRRFSRDPDSILLLHLDHVFGPFLLNDSANEAMVVRTGKAHLAVRD